jgi:Histidine kinase
VVQALRFVLDAWREVTLRQVLGTSLLGLVWSAVVIVTQTDYLRGPVPLTPSINAVLSMQFNGFAVLFAVLLADRASTPAAPRWWIYAIAVLAGVIAGSSFLWLVSQRALHLTSATQLPGSMEGFGSFAFRHGSHALVVCGMVAFVYAVQRMASQRAAALRMLQLECAITQRRVVESRLAAARARLEPQFLLHTLTEVELLYAADPRNADRVLRELTAYLRATIPELREPASTVATEVRITNAFLNILSLQSRDRAILGAGAALADRVRMLPMILLPLVQHAIGRRPLERRDEAVLTIDLAASTERLAITIHDKEGGFSPETEHCPAVRQVRERLAELHGDDSRLTLRDEPPGSAVTVELPLEFALSRDAGVAAASAPKLADCFREVDDKTV